MKDNKNPDILQKLLLRPRGTNKYDAEKAILAEQGVYGVIGLVLIRWSVPGSFALLMIYPDGVRSMANIIASVIHFLNLG